MESFHYYGIEKYTSHMSEELVNYHFSFVHILYTI